MGELAVGVYRGVPGYNKRITTVAVDMQIAWLGGFCKVQTNPAINYVLKCKVRKTNHQEEFVNTVCHSEHPSDMWQPHWSLRRRRTGYTASTEAIDNSGKCRTLEHPHHPLSNCNVHLLELVVLMGMLRNF